MICQELIRRVTYRLHGSLDMIPFVYEVLIDISHSNAIRIIHLYARAHSIIINTTAQAYLYTLRPENQFQCSLYTYINDVFKRGMNSI